MVGVVVMLAMLRKWGVETDAESYRPLWLLSSAISATVHLCGWTIKAGSQHKAEPASESESETEERESLLRPAREGDDDADEDDDGEKRRGQESSGVLLTRVERGEFIRGFDGGAFHGLHL